MATDFEDAVPQLFRESPTLLATVFKRVFDIDVDDVHIVTADAESLGAHPGSDPGGDVFS